MAHDESTSKPDSIASLAERNRARASLLRTVEIPRLRATSRAAEGFANEVTLLADQALAESVGSGELADLVQRSIATAERRGATGAAAVVKAVAVLLRGQTMRTSRFLRGRAEDLRTAAERTEGQADALLAQADELELLLAASADRSRPPTLPTSDARPDTEVRAEANQ